MPKHRVWTRKKRKRARAKAEVTLRRRRAIIGQTQDRTDSDFAGALPLFEYAREHLDLPKQLDRGLKMKKGTTAVFSPTDEAMAYLGAQILGIWRLNNLDKLVPEGLLVKALGLPRWPSDDTQRRFLKRANPLTLQGVDKTMQAIIESEELIKRRNGPIWVGADITALESRARKREGAVSGYCNGRKRICLQAPRVCVQGLPWWTDLRPGNDPCEDVFDIGLKTCRGLLKDLPGRAVHFRMDSGFSSKEHLTQLQAERKKHSAFHFYLAIPRHHVSQAWWEDHAGLTRQAWRQINETTWVKDLGWCSPWEETGPARLVAVRRYKRKQMKRGQKVIRKVIPQIDKEYLIATSKRSRKGGARRIFDGYHTRQGDELSFKDGKQSLSLKKLPAQELMGNRLHVKMVSLAHVQTQIFARNFMSVSRPFSAKKEPAEQTSGFLIHTLREKVFSAKGEKKEFERDLVVASA